MGRFISHYPIAILVKDYARAIAGLAIVILILSVSQESIPAFRWFVAGLGLLFLGFLFQTIGRHRQRIEYDEKQIALFRPLFRGQKILWHNLSNVRLRYWGRRKKKDGVLSLSLSDGKSTIVIDEGLSHFTSIVERVIKIAGERNLELDEITADNMTILKKIWGNHEAIADGARS